MTKKISTSIFTILFSCLTLSGCAHADSKNSANDLQKKYGTESNYFLGLCDIDNQKNKDAINHFQKALSSKSELISTLAVKELISISPSKSALSYAENFHRVHNSNESLTILLEQLYDNEQFSKILSLTKDLDFSTADDSISFFHCASLLATGDASFPGIFNLWCTSKPFSSYHKRIINLMKDYPENEFAFTTEISKMQTYVYGKDWGPAFVYAKKLLDEKKNLKPQLVSDVGKSMLYGSTDYETNGAYLESLLTGNQEIDYYLHFYAGRIYSKLESTVTNSLENYEKAMGCADTDEKFDNALWYYLMVSKDNSLDETVEATKKYCSQWHDPNYFDDFLEPLSVELLDEQKWESYYSLTETLKDYASPEAFAKFSYTTGSLIENDFYLPKNSNKKDLTKKFYEQALNGGCNSYHKLMAAAKLGLSDDETWKYFSLWDKDENFVADEDVEKVLYGYVDFDLSDRIFSFWLDNYSKISLECVNTVSQFLYEKAKDDSDLYYTSLRVAAKKINFSEKELDSKIFELSFPRGFSDSIEKYCDEYGLPNYLAYSLIRMESFYAPNAISHAGAIGLCQLMESTAGDVAKKLGKKDYDLMDPNTNVQFGTNYLAELISRTDAPLLAICSYNAGIGKIRSTVKKYASLIKRSEIPNDIFLEMLPITETRKYGRDVSAVAGIYGYLYFGKSPTMIMREIVRF